MDPGFSEGTPGGGDWQPGQGLVAEEEYPRVGVQTHPLAQLGSRCLHRCWRKETGGSRKMRTYADRK